MRTSSLLLALAVGCGAAPSRAASVPTSPPLATRTPAPAPATLVETWAVEECPRVDADRVEDDGARSYFLSGSDRIVRDAEGLHRATDVPEASIMTAVHAGDTWTFDTYGGALFRSTDGFIGALTAIGRMPGGHGDLSISGETVLVRAEDGTFWYVDAAQRLVPVPLPVGRIAVNVAVPDARTFVVLAEPGDLFVSHDAGATYALLHPGDAVADVGVVDGRAMLETVTGARLTLDARDAITASPAPAETEDEEAGDWERVRARIVETQAARSEESDQALWNDDPWCSELPIDFVTQWRNGPTPRDAEGLELPSRCEAAPGDAHVLALCTPRRLAASQGRELLLVDPADGTLRPLPGVPHVARGEGLSVIDSAGSRTFVVETGTETAPRFTWVDGESVTPLALGALRIEDVHDDLAIARSDDDDTFELIRLPTGEVVPLELPGGVGAITAAIFLADGAIEVGTRGAGGDDDRVELRVGRPGAWSLVPIPEGAWRLFVADARHVVAQTGEHVQLSSDLGATWSVGPAMFEMVRCTVGGCALGRGLVWRSPTLSVHTRHVVAAAPETQREDGERSHAPRWRCEATHAARWSGAAVAHLRSDWGVATLAHGDGTDARITWTGIDARGVFQSRGALPPTEAHWHAALALTRAYAVVWDGAGLGVVGPHPERLALAVPQTGWRFRGGALPDGRAMLVFAASAQSAYDPQLGVLLDATGHVVGQRTYTWRRSLFTRTGYAGGPDGAAGLAVTQDARHWTVYPVDGSAPVALDAPLDGAGPCDGPRPWTIVAEPVHGALGELDLGAPLRDATLVIGTGDGAACIVALLGGDRDQDGVGAAYAGPRGMIGAVMDESPRGTAMSCSAAPSTEEE